MADYRLPMDADGVKYHGTIDQNEENPGHFMYGLDENGNKRIIRTDEQGNVLTKVTGRKVEEELIPRGVYNSNEVIFASVPDWSKGVIVSVHIHALVGDFSNDGGINIEARATLNSSSNVVKNICHA